MHIERIHFKTIKRLKSNTIEWHLFGVLFKSRSCLSLDSPESPFLPSATTGMCRCTKELHKLIYTWCTHRTRPVHTFRSPLIIASALESLDSLGRDPIYRIDACINAFLRNVFNCMCVCVCSCETIYQTPTCSQPPVPANCALPPQRDRRWQLAEVFSNWFG